MANLIAIARGTNAGSNTECSRLADVRASVGLNSWQTFVTVEMEKDGSTVIAVFRGHRDDPTLLTEVQLNSEHADSPLITCDGLLRTQTIAATMDSDIASSFEPRTIISDIEEDR